jgi:hypothetical protein
MLSPSDIVVRPTNLAERLAAQPVTPEPTPTTMAERFAPEGQKLIGEDPAELTAEPVIPGYIAGRASARVSSAGQGLLIAAILISLIPTAAILALLWQGVITIPGHSDAQKFTDRPAFGTSDLAALAPAPALQPAPPAPAPEPVVVVAPAPKPAVPEKIEVALTAPSQIAAKSGEEVPFTIAIDADGALPARSVIAIRAMPDGATFSQGRPYGTSEWNLTPDEIGDLKLKLPKTAAGGAEIGVALMSPDGAILASTTTRLDILPDPNSVLVLRSDEAGRVSDLIAHGHKMIDVGYFAGARAYFKRAAEAGSGEAALLLGATYDAEFIAKIGAHGIKPDPQEAQVWYERARKLGVQDLEAKLRMLKEDVSGRSMSTQATMAPVQPAVVAEAQPQPMEQPAPVEEVDPAPGAAETMLPTDSDQWVELTNYANLRTAPSSNADTLRVAEKGSKLRVTGRKGSWVQVTDPTTAEVGWVYGRYIQTSPER